MARFEVVRGTSISAAEVWRRLTDWGQHGRFIPFTTISIVSPHSVGAGARFVARTAIGPIGFDDPMEVVAWRAATADSTGYCRILKTGNVVLGWAELTVRPTPTGADVHWREEATVAAVGRWLDLPTRVLGRRVFSRLLDGLLVDQAS